ncbi:MAG TPA: class II glutamine amidotransferase [Hyphomicrobiaceae bacterium]|nr:class II glutamine amidotransferase [Hyphomicrobiaceae bacterium]
MCRVLIYKGEPVSLDALLFRPNNSLIRQSYEPQLLDALSLAGFGMLAWDDRSPRPAMPFAYKTPGIPLFDDTLKSLAEKIDVTTLIAHVRGVAYEAAPTIGEQNLHPFRYRGMSLALAHNGQLAGFERMRFALLAHIKPEIARLIRGNTDSEWIYALLLSALDDPTATQSSDAILAALERTLVVLRTVRHEHNIAISSPANLFVTDGTSIVATRFTFDFGCYDPSDVGAIAAASHRYLDMWYTTGGTYAFEEGEWRMSSVPAGETRSLIISSEPLTRDPSTWFEVPEYSALVVSIVSGQMSHRVKFLDA